MSVWYTDTFIKALCKKKKPICMNDITIKNSQQVTYGLLFVKINVDKCAKHVVLLPAHQ